MQNTRYLIVGGGMTGAEAAKAIREHDSDGAVTLVGAEPHPPYKRPPLTKKLWSGGEESSIWKGTDELGIDLRLSRRISKLDLDESRAVDDKGDEYAYEKVLLATGGRPRRLGGDDSEVIYFRTLDDYRRLRGLAGEGKRVVVIGGGFIGTEIAAALTTNGCAVTMVVPEQWLNARLLPAGLGAFVTDYYREKGVEVITGESVASVDRTSVSTGSGRVLEADAVVAGLGIVPETELAEAAGLRVENGIVVDEYGRADRRDDVFAAGDVANFPSPVLGGVFRIEHEDHANTHGKVVGSNMAGAGLVYDHLPFFYSDLFDLGYEAVGELDSRIETIETWEEPNRKGVIAYVDEERRPRGFLLWDVWGKVDAARELLRAGQPIGERVVV
jgi:3-phenylpropionate/trans-cinnamate dioxygenase ferredoxin reductase subunit